MGGGSVNTMLELAGQRGSHAVDHILDAQRIHVDPFDDEHVVAAAEDPEAKAGAFTGMCPGAHHLDVIVGPIADERMRFPLDCGEDQFADRALGRRHDRAGGRVDQFHDEQALAEPVQAVPMLALCRHRAQLPEPINVASLHVPRGFNLFPVAGDGQSGVAREQALRTPSAAGATPSLCATCAKCSAYEGGESSRAASACLA